MQCIVASEWAEKCLDSQVAAQSMFLVPFEIDSEHANDCKQFLAVKRVWCCRLDRLERVKVAAAVMAQRLVPARGQASCGLAVQRVRTVLVGERGRRDWKSAHRQTSMPSGFCKLQCASPAGPNDCTL